MRNATILIVDDSTTDVILIQSILYDYNLMVARDGVEAMQIVESNPGAIDIMILDINMPRMNGFEVLRALQKHQVHKRISTLILTNYDEIDNEMKGLNLGALDYIRKPLNMRSLRKRIQIHIDLRNSRKQLEENNILLEQTVQERTIELVQTRDMTIHALLGLLEIRNIESANHTKRTQWMMKILCEHLKDKDPYRSILTDSYINELFSTAPLHDIGKVGIPDSILLKPGKLTPEEYEIMKTHTTLGVNALRHEAELADRVSFIKTAIEIVATHHEKYDGSGYPNGLKGDEIPLSGRLMAIVDVYDALRSKRVYKPPIGHEQALEIINDEKGRHFDPRIVKAFFDIEESISRITHHYHSD